MEVEEASKGSVGAVFPEVAMLLNGWSHSNALVDVTTADQSVTMIQ